MIKIVIQSHLIQDNYDLYEIYDDFKFMQLLSNILVYCRLLQLWVDKQ